jgi:vacuolar-type H+-ATPase subunit H
MDRAEREMTLQEWVERLPSCHSARREYEELLKRADLSRPTEDAEKLVDELIEAIRKHDACVRGGYDDYVEEYDKIINNLKSRLLSLNKEVVDRINKTISAIDSVNDYLKNGQLEDAIIVVSPSDWESLKKDIEALGRG